MSASSLLVVVLAAGMGTRMKSAQPKVMHHVGGKAMIGHVIDLAVSVGRDMTNTSCAIVVGPDMDQVADMGRVHFEGAEIFVQEERLGTAHAVLSARSALEAYAASGNNGLVLVLYGDTPLLTKEALNNLISELDNGADVGVLGFEAIDPSGYGRLIVDDKGTLSEIVEQKDASVAQRKVTLCNSGVMGFKASVMVPLLDKISNENANKEYYLTDVIGLAKSEGLKAVVTVCGEADVLGVNDRVQLSEAERLFQGKRREAAQRGGATLIAPETVFFSHDTKLGKDVVIEPNVVFGTGVTVGDGVTIHGFCHIVGAVIEAGAVVGPFARLRPGALIGPSAKVGNFCEIKNADIKQGAKVNHLSYIGDAEVGSGANIGAGTITCNYDGFFKHKTIIGENSFVGSNSSLIAPVTIGEGAYIGSGSVISEDVPSDALSVTRASLRTIPNWAAKYRKSQQRKKDAQ